MIYTYIRYTRIIADDTVKITITQLDLHSVIVVSVNRAFRRKPNKHIVPRLQISFKRIRVNTLSESIIRPL